MKAFVTEANYHDGTVASWLLPVVKRRCPRFAMIWADQAYRGKFIEKAETLKIAVEVVAGLADQSGFQVQARRWVVERTFAWLSNYRRLSKDYEQWVTTSDSWIYVAMTHLMLRRLARIRAKSELLE